MATPPDTVWQLQVRYGDGSWVDHRASYRTARGALKALRQAREDEGHVMTAAAPGREDWPRFTFRVVKTTTEILPD